MYGKWIIALIVSVVITAVIHLWQLLQRLDTDLGIASFIIGWHTFVGLASLVPIIWLFVAEDKKRKKAREGSTGSTPDA